MRDVDRPPQPPSLATNATGWTAELLAAIDMAEETGGSVPEALFRRYDQLDVRLALQTMYSGLCCYCEARVSSVAYEHIEHRRPKKRFPGETYDWNNLHSACPRCNQSKGQKWDPAAEILDAASDHPIDEHLSYRSGNLGVYRWPRSARGKTTVDHADLNSAARVTDRGQLLLRTLEAIRQINDEPEAPDAATALKQLRELSRGEHGSLVRWALDTFLRT